MTTKTRTPDEVAAEYTHSVWSGKKYGRPQTAAELTAESKAVLRRHPTIGPLIAKPIDFNALAYFKKDAS